MKFILSFIGVSVVALAFGFCSQKTESTNEDYMRIHITANSNSTQDQNMKYLVKDAVVEFLIPMLADAEDKSQASEIICQNLDKIEEVVNCVLKNQNVEYLANVNIVEEEMPARAYDDLVLEAGVYESLNIALGEAKGDNWWCIVFPAVCFLDTKNFDNLEYISKIWDIINDVTNQKKENL